MRRAARYHCCCRGCRSENHVPTTSKPCRHSTDPDARSRRDPEVFGAHGVAPDGSGSRGVHSGRRRSGHYTRDRPRIRGERPARAVFRSSQGARPGRVAPSRGSSRSARPDRLLLVRRRPLVTRSCGGHAGTAPGLRFRLYDAGRGEARRRAHGFVCRSLSPAAQGLVYSLQEHDRCGTNLRGPYHGLIPPASMGMAYDPSRTCPGQVHVGAMPGRSGLCRSKYLTTHGDHLSRSASAQFDNEPQTRRASTVEPRFGRSGVAAPILFRRDPRAGRTVRHAAGSHLVVERAIVANTGRRGVPQSDGKVVFRREGERIVPASRAIRVPEDVIVLLVISESVGEAAVNCAAGRLFPATNRPV